MKGLDEMKIKSFYKILRELDDDRDLTTDEFELANIIQGQIQDLEINQLGEMHPYHTGTLKVQFCTLDKNNL
jgi:hypothetical protein